MEGITLSLTLTLTLILTLTLTLTLTLALTLTKGCYNIGMPSNKPLFQYYCERITAVKRLAAAHAGVDEATVRLPFVIMCSHATSAETIAFFDKHNHFGLPKDQVIFFNQGTMPCFTLDGKLTLSEP